jgi:hypothetical protein
MRAPETTAARRLLVVAHPGHELRVHGWLEQAKPEVWVLTDGSGHGALSRVPSTRRVLAAAGVAPGPVFGRWSDREAYRILLEGDTSAVGSIVDELAKALTDEHVELVAGDAFEGFNPVHDLCRLIIDLAVLVAETARGRSLKNCEFPLEAAPGWEARPQALRLQLDNGQLDRKLAVAHSYPELRGEVDRALRSHGRDAFRNEWLSPVEPLATLSRACGRVVPYERYGEGRVRLGYYTRVLRYREHFAPLAERLVAAFGATSARRRCAS